MPIYSVQGPDGRIYELEGPAGASEAEIISAVRRQYLMSGTAPAAAPKEGLMADVMGAGANLLNIGRTGIAALTGDTTQAAQAGVARQEELQKKYKSGFDPEKITAPFEQGQYGTAAGEALKQVPSAVATVAPSVLQTAGLAAAGRLGGGALGSLLGPVGTVAGAQIGQYALPAVVGFIQALGGQAQEKVQTQKEAGEKPDVDALALAPYAAGSAALDLIGAKVAMPSFFKKMGGQKVAEETADAAAAAARSALIADARKVAGRGTFETILRGTGGFALGELPTEVLQEVLDRAAVGKSLTDDEAMKSYRSTALLTVLAAPIGAGVGVAGRSGARTTVEQEDKQIAAKAAAEAAAAEEAARTTPEALTRLDTQYQDAKRRMAELQAAVAKKPTKASTPEEKQAYTDAKQELTRFQKEDFAPLSTEYAKRKDAISAMQDAQLADIEQKAAVGQPTAAAPVSVEEPKRDVQKLMLEQDTLRRQLEALEGQLGQAAPEQFDTLNAQRQELQRRIDARATLIEEAGGSPLAQAEFEQATSAKMQGIDSRMEKLTATYTAALEAKDYDAAAKAKDELLALRQERTAFTDKTSQQMQAMQEKQQSLEQRGQTRELGLDEPAQPPQEGLTFTAPITAAAPAEEPIKSKQLTSLVTAQQKVAAAQEELDAAVQNKTAQTPAELYPLLDKLNQAQNASLRASEDVGRPTLKPTILDIFSPANLFNTAYANGDTNLLNALARQTDSTTLKTTLDEKASEREKLTRLLDTRLDLAGQSRERADLFSKQYEPKQQALFKNGTYPDKELQDLYDKGGPAAVEYENVMSIIEALSSKVTTKQGNAKKSLYEKLVDLAEQHAELTAQMETGIAVPTKGEKVAALQAKLGKGEVPAARQMDAAERNNLQRRITTIENAYRLAEGKVAPIRDQVARTYASLYKQTPLETVEKEREAKKALLLPETGARSMSKTARTQARIAAGDVRKEAETSATMRDLAEKLGQQTPEYLKFVESNAKRLAALRAKYGNDDIAVAEFRNTSYEATKAKAQALGRATPEYKATLKEQIEITREALAGSKQELKSKRGTQTTRKVSLAKKEEATGSPESRAVGAKRHAVKAMSVAEQERVIRETGTSEQEEGRGFRPPNLAPTSDKTEAAIPATSKTELPTTDEIRARDAAVTNVFKVAADYTSPYHGKTYAEAADLAAKESNVPLLKTLFSALGKSLASQPKDDMYGRVFITNKAGFNEEMGLERVTGLFDQQRKLVIAPSESLSADANLILLHELSHAATAAGLRSNDELYDTVSNLRKQVDVWLETADGKAYYEANKETISAGTGGGKAAYGLTDNFEFIAEVFSNKSFQALLRQIPSTTPQKSVWQKLVDVFAKFFDLRTDGQRTLLEDALEAADRAMVSTEKAATSTDTPAFKKWFRRSEVVNSSGEPLVVYHGTSGDITEFKYDVQQGSGAMHGRGFYFGNADTASAYAGEDRANVIPVYLRMENPFFGTLTKEDVAKISKRMPAFEAAYKEWQTQTGPDATYMPSIERLGVLSGDRNNFIQQALIAAGYDGRIVTSDPEAFQKDPETEYVVFNPAQIKSAVSNRGTYDIASTNILQSSANIGVKDEGKGVFSFTSRRTPGEFDATPEPSAVDKVLGNIMGLAGRMQLVDKFAAVSEAFKVGMNKGVLTDVEAGNAEFLLRFGEHRSQYANQFITNGPVSLVTTKTDKGVEHTYKSTKGPTPLGMAEALSKGGFANDSEAEGLLGLVTSGERAKQVGWEKLNYSDPAAAKAKYERALAHLEANPKQKAAIKEAMAIYQKFNNGLMDFLVQVGELTSAKAAELKAITYVPFYRVTANGEVQLMIDKERPVRIGNIKDEPQLQQLVGDNKQIMPIFASMVQNTFMLTNLGLRNQTVKETAFTLRKIGIASRIGKGPGPASPNIVRFKKNGEDMHVVIDTDMYGIPAKYIVEGMEGIKTTIPAVVKLLGIPADLLRKFVTRAPPYAIRQTIRDPLNAWLTTGTDAFPVLSSFKELGSMVAGRSETERILMESGAVSSNVFTGDERDMSKVLREITSGKAGWTKLLAKADAFALQGDTATRAVIYRDSIAKGMSHQQALLRSVESMNFSRRGLSPSIQMLSTMIPFFNAQIQGLDVLYRAFKGDMSYNEQLKIREKLFQRGMLLAIGTMAYAAAMQDDEAYKRAKPEERYGNWFVYVPGVSEPLRVPIPFELGYLFKALPEAVYNMAAGDEKASTAAKGIGTLLAQSNPFALPQAIKPLTEVVLGKSFFSGDIESEREKSVMATQRYRDSSTEVSKLIGSVTGEVGLSPIKIDYLIRGYTGGLGVALVQLANPLLNTEAAAGVEKPSMKPSKMPFIGGLFQPVEGRGTLDAAYDKMLEIQQTKGTYNKLVEEGKRAEAQAFVQQYANQLSLVSTSGSVQKALGEMAKQERFIKASPKMTTEQKDVALERLDKMKGAYARQFLTLADRTTPR